MRSFDLFYIYFKGLRLQNITYKASIYNTICQSSFSSSEYSAKIEIELEPVFQLSSTYLHLF